MPNATALVMSQMEREGVSLAEWARLRGYNVRTVRAVVRGELLAKRGISHKIAVELGIKNVKTPRSADV